MVAYRALPMTEVFAQSTTSTTDKELPRIVGDHPGNVVVIGAAVLLLVAILAAGFAVRRRASAGAGRH